MKRLKTLVKVVGTSLIISVLSGCIAGDVDGVWRQYSWGIKEERFYYWFLGKDYESYDRCVKAAKYEMSKSASSYTSGPVGCGYSSDSYFSTILNYYLHAERDHMQCVAESYDPDNSRPYVMLLKGYDIPEGQGRCVW